MLVVLSGIARLEQNDLGSKVCVSEVQRSRDQGSSGVRGQQVDRGQPSSVQP